MTVNSLPASAIAEMMEQQEMTAQGANGSSSEGTMGTESGNAAPAGPSAGDAGATGEMGESMPEPSNPAPAQKPDEPQPAQQQSDETQPTESRPVAAQPSKIQSAPFEQTKTVDDTAITVKAPADTFPEGATLSIDKAPAADQRKVDEAVAPKREEAVGKQANVAAAYTFDIKVLDAEGKELQPAVDHKVEVSFALPQAADKNLDATVYHVEEQKEAEKLVAQKLEATENEAEKKVTAKTDGFSYYTVEFTYGKLQYVLPGNGSAKLVEILRAVGLTGEPQAVTVSNPELFSASKETGEWVVTARKAFDTKEWMKVTIANVEYRIEVTDSPVGQPSLSVSSVSVNYYDPTDEINPQTCNDGIAYENQRELTTGWYVVQGTRDAGGRIKVPEGNQVNIILCDDATLTCAGINIDAGETGASLTIWAQEGGTGKLVTNGKSTSRPGIRVPPKASLTINGGDIDARSNTKNCAGIGGADRESSGEITVNGGKVVAVGSKYGAGIGGGNLGRCEGTITFNGGKVNATGGESAAGIGGGDGGAKSGNSGTIIVNGGDITGKGGDGGAGVGGGDNSYGADVTVNDGILVGNGGWYGAGIGGGQDGDGYKLVVNGGRVSAYPDSHAAGIGGGENGDGGEVQIHGGTVIARGYYLGAPIGGGDDGKNGPITITGGTVSAKAIGMRQGREYTGSSAAAIGAGAGEKQGGPIIISGGEVNASTDGQGAGIGGAGDNGDGRAGGVIHISGPNTKVFAKSFLGAGIGSGGTDTGADGAHESGARGGDITIDDGYVFAASIGAGAGIGGGKDGNGGNIVINGGNVVAHGGATSYKWYEHTTQSDGISKADDPHLKDMENDFYDKIGDLVMDALFSGDYSGSGIGGGDNANGGHVEINGGFVEATGGTDSCSAIGWGDGADGDTMSRINLSIYEDCRVLYGDYGSDKDIHLKGVTDDPNEKVYRSKKSNYARIEAKQCIVDFDVDEKCEAPPRQHVFTGGKVKEPYPNPAAEGFAFTGWYTDEARTTPYDFNQPVELYHMTLYAKWVPVHSVKIDKEWVDTDTPPQTNARVTYVSSLDEGTIGGYDYAVPTETEDLKAIEGGSVYIQEHTVDGYVLAGATLAAGDTSVALPANAAGDAINLNLTTQEASGLNDEDYKKAVRIMNSDQAVITLKNTKGKIFSVEKKWEDGFDQNDRTAPRPENVGVVLQKKNGDGSTWETVGDPLTLTADNGWKGSFPAVGTNADNQNYRIRELDDNNQVVEVAAGNLVGEVTRTLDLFYGRTKQVTYQVSYDETNEQGNTTITNTFGQPYTVKMQWVDGSDSPLPDKEIPEGAKVEFWTTDEGEQGRLASATLNSANSWQKIFSPQVFYDNYGVREVDDDNNAVDASGGKAHYNVTIDGKQRTIEYDVTITEDPTTHTYTIKNKKVGYCLYARKLWRVTDTSRYQQFTSEAVLQHKENGTWKTVDAKVLSPAPAFTCDRVRFAAVPVDGDQLSDYRIREFISERVVTNWTEGNQPARGFVSSDFTDGQPGVSTAAELLPPLYMEQQEYGESDKVKVLLDVSDDGYAGQTHVNTHQTKLLSTEQFSTSYVTTYENASNGDVIIANREVAPISVKKEWVGDKKAESVTAVLQVLQDGSWTEKEWKVLNEANDWKANFSETAALGMSAENYRVRELDKDGNVILDASDDHPDDATTNATTHTIEDSAGKEVDASFKVTYAAPDDKGQVTITNTLTMRELTIEKKWDIDATNNDKPSSVEVVLQKKGEDDWETVSTFELKNDNKWKVNTYVPAKQTVNGREKEIEYRVRELREETALNELMEKLREPIEQGQAKYNEWLEQLKTEGKSYWEGLPEDIREAADNGYDSLLQKLGANTPNDLFGKLKDKLSLDDTRIIYDDDDEDKSGETNRASFHVDAYQSAVEGQVDAHTTTYKVDYDDDDGTFTIKNKAILDIDVIKRWLKYGVDDDDMPDSVWVVLMCKPNATAKDNASTAGIDLGGLMSYEFPVINPIEGGNNPISIISQLALGIDLSIFDSLGFVPKMAIAKVDGDDDWKQEFVVSKYTIGIPMDYKGAELSSEVIRQIIKYLIGVDMPVSYNPFDNYVSIPTKAIHTVMGIEQPGALIDFSGLVGKAKDMATSLTKDDIKDFGWDSFVDDDRLMANVINIKIDGDSDDEPGKIKGTKTWADKQAESTDVHGNTIPGFDHSAERPDTLKIHVRGKDNRDIEGSPIVLNKENFKDDHGNYRDVWDWELKLPEGVSKKDCTVTEEYPEDYQHKDDYLLTVDGFNLSNAWRNDVIYGQKTWKDGNNQEGLRPESIRVHLYAQVEGGEKTEVQVKNELEMPSDGETQQTDAGTTSESGDAGTAPGPTGIEVSEKTGWRWFFEAPRETADHKAITYSIEEDPVEGYITEYDGFNITNERPTKVNVSKEWKDGDNQDGIRPQFVTVKLYADGEDTGKTLVLNGDNSWAGSFENLAPNKAGNEIVYSVEEETNDVVSGEDGPGTYDVAVSETTQEPGGGTSGGGGPAPIVPVRSFKITNIHTPEKTTVSGEKTWNDANDQDGKRPESITIKLLANGAQKQTKDVTAADDWSWTFADLPKYEAGTEIAYSIAEEEIDANRGYTTEVNGFNVTNTHVPATVTVSGTKTWDDNNNENGVRPESITVRLRANGKEIANETVPDDHGNWTWRFENLPKYEVGKEISYDVTEDAVDNYTAQPDGGMDLDTGALERNIKNVCTIGKTQVNVFKVWDDDNDRDAIRPKEVTVELLANGESTGQRKTLSADDGWKTSFTALDTGKNYSVREVLDDVVTGVDGERIYAVDPQIEGDAKQGFTITNKHTPKKTHVTVSKRWEDDNNRDGKREPVSLKLMANGEPYGSAMVGDENDWTYTFEDLPAKDRGRDITYTVREQDVALWDMTVEGNAATGFSVTNRHDPEKVTVAGRKTWDDNGGELEKRPESITIRLFANGREIRSQEVTAASNWSWEFGDLYKYEAGKEIVYTITEDAVANYTTEVDGYDVTNTYEPGKTQVSVTKAWNDNSNQDGRRPSKVIVHLLADGKDTGKILILTDSVDWTGSFTDLDLKADGKDISYSVQEDDVNGYTSNVAGDAEKGFTITNTYQPETVSVSVRKAWNDGIQGIVQHAPVVVHLYANGQEVEGKTLTSANFWMWTCEGLPKYKDGKEISYTVSEDAMSDYAVAVSGNAKDGFVITNTNTPGKTSLSVRKVWKDDYDRDRVRPASITVRLMADGKDTGKRLELSEANGWSGIFNEIDDNPNVAYTVAEDRSGAWAEAYFEPETMGDAKKGFTIVNEHQSESTNVNVTKRWEDDGNTAGVRPASITLRLHANGTEVDSQRVTGNGTSEEWECGFSDLPAKEDGRKIAYTVTEDVVPDYATTYSKSGSTYNVTNRYGEDTIGKTQVTVHQVWADANDQDGLRPKSAVVYLLANGKPTGMSVTLGEKEGVQAAAEADDDTAWFGIFEGLPVKDEHGSAIRYSVSKDPLPYYDTYYYGYAKRGFTIVDEHEPQVTNVSVAKKWEGEGMHPDSVTVRLLADGKDTGKAIVLNEANDWKDVFEGLLVKEAGKEIAYTVSEDEVEGYAATVTGSAADGFTITNKRKAEERVTPPPTPAPDPDGKKGIITYQLNGGSYNGSTEDIVESYDVGTVISVHEAPTRDGYTFSYWKGSEYQPGDKYTVSGDHTFVAQWTESGTSNPSTPAPKSDDPSNPGTNTATSGNSTTLGSTRNTTSGTATPKTGDERNQTLWIALMSAALGLLILALRRRKA